LQGHPLLKFRAVRDAYHTGIRMAVGTCPAEDVTFTVKKNGVQVGTLVVTRGGATAFGLPWAVSDGDVLEVDAPDGDDYADDALADVGLTLLGALGSPEGGEAATSTVTWECEDDPGPCPDPDPKLEGVMGQEDLF